VLVTSPDVPVISFTGSSATGRAISANAAPELKRLGLELGGKTPMVVFDDADVVAAAGALTNGKGVDIALDAVGGDMFEPTLKTLRRVDSTTSSKSEMAVGLADRPSKTKPRFR
jgi:hypothetical protein